MEHDFDPLRQVCKTCGLGRADVEDDPMAARCVGMTITDRHKMALMVTAEGAAEIEKMPQPFRMYAQLIGRETVEKIAADVFNRPTKVYCLPEDLETAKRLIGDADVPLPERGFGT